MSEEELLIQLEQVTARRRETEAYTEEWAALCYEMGRLTAAIWRVRRGSPPLPDERNSSPVANAAGTVGAAG